VATLRKSQYPPRDRDGRRLKEGDVVRVIGAPDFSNRSDAVAKAEVKRVFGYIVGKYLRIADLKGDHGAELEFSISRGRDAGIHFVWIEPWLLKLRQPRKRRRSILKK